MDLKEKIKKTVSENKSDKNLLNLISGLKSKTLENDGLYNNLSDIEHSLYRYNTLTDSRLFDAAKEEGSRLLSLTKNLDTETKVLKGSVSNTKYIWKTEPDACEKCQSKDGKEFTNKDDIPEKPHPNCKCKIEEVPEDYEECDCGEFFKELDNLSENIDSAKQDADVIEKFVKNAITVYSNSITANIAYSLMDELQTAMNAYHDFQKNKAEMIKFRENDKYHHAKANCEAVKRGLTGEIMAYILSYGKEVYDIFKKVIFDGMEFERAWNDSLEDLQADRYGIHKGHEPEACKESVKNAGDIIKVRN